MMMRARTGWLMLLLALCAGCSAPLTENADRIVIVKSAHTMTLMNNGLPLKTYRVAIGKGGMGPKVQRGDSHTPEGE